MLFVKTELGADPIVIDAYLAAPLTKVYAAWTDPKIVMKWFGPKPNTLVSADIDLRIGGAWRFVMRNDATGKMGFEGEYIQIDPNKRLVFKWSKFDEISAWRREDIPTSVVDITLTSVGSGTNIHIVHSAIDDEATRIGFTGGWEHGMENLREMLTEYGALGV